jgi:hypothetical protein
VWHYLKLLFEHRGKRTGIVVSDYDRYIENALPRREPLQRHEQTRLLTTMTPDIA